MPDLMSDRIKVVLALDIERSKAEPSQDMIKIYETVLRVIDRDKRWHKDYIENTIPTGDRDMDDEEPEVILQCNICRSTLAIPESEYSPDRQKCCPRCTWPMKRKDDE